MVSAPVSDELDLTRSSTTARGRLWAILLPFAGVLAAYVVMAFVSAASILSRQYPITPWESAIVGDAWRVTRGLPVYTEPATGHATHMYGPLVTYLTAVGVKWRGVDVTLPRYFSFGFALLVCGGVGWLAASARRRSPRGSIGVFLLGFSLVFVEFYRVVAWFTEARPDMAAIFFSLLSLCCFYRAACENISRKRAFAWTAAACMFLLTGFFFKQTAAAVALVPPVAIVVSGLRPMRKYLPPAFAGLVALGIALLFLRLAYPWVYFHMVTIASRHAIENYPLEFLQLLGGSTLFFSAFFVWMMCEPDDPRHARMAVWTLSAVVVLAFTGTAAVAKVGGYYNSHLPTMVAMTFFVLLVLPGFLFALVTADGMIERRWLAAIVLPLLLAADMAVPTRRLDPAGMLPRHGHPRYAGVVKAVSGLPGKVICPEDPTIPILAKGFAGRSWECELDAVGRAAIPPYCFDELRSADWLVQVTASRTPLLSPADLASHGFDPAPGILPENSVYTLWKKVEAK